ncbi:MAG: alpha-L-glutamate ligase-like protein [Proteobacteria bacterium]|nr:alpha-L-glutamate ligase-like protein [Pseudomonadota bacterium]
MTGLLQTLRRQGVLGINRRNASLLMRWNPRAAYPHVDDKLVTKERCAAAGIPVPQLLGAARHHFELNGLLESLRERPSFVLKPARGAMGNGILVIVDRDGHRVQRAGGRWIDEQTLRYHGASIISGLYALGGHRDAALVEERLQVHPTLDEIAAAGVPDLRVIVYRGVPVMCMMRLPTRSSAGRANLHQGAVGAGVELDSGRTGHAVLNDAPIDEHPDTHRSVVGVAVPHFSRLIEIAVRASDTSGLGYVGADVVVDAHRGPLVLELNARPGLSIQVANRAGLLPRLREIDALAPEGKPYTDRIALGQLLAQHQRSRPA